MPLRFSTAAEFIAAIVVGILLLFLSLVVFLLVHQSLDRCYHAYARRFCRARGLTVVRGNSGPHFDESGIKTEFTRFELDCLDAQMQRRRVELLIWIFGVRKVISNVTVPENGDRPHA